MRRKWARTIPAKVQVRLIDLLVELAELVLNMTLILALDVRLEGDYTCELECERAVMT